MENCRVVEIDDSWTLWCGDQHISRMTQREVRNLVLQIVVFGGKEFRDEFHEWMTDGKVDQVADYLEDHKERVHKGVEP